MERANPVATIHRGFRFLFPEKRADAKNGGDSITETAGLSRNIVIIVRYRVI